MRFALGGFGFAHDIPDLIDAGFDYAELDAPELEAMDSRDFEALRRALRERQFHVPVAGRILPIAEPLIFKPGFCPEDYRDYLERSCARAGALGVEKIIFGNGKARSWLESTTIQDVPIFIRFMRMLCEVATGHGLEVLLEPLGPRYSNFINTIPQAAEIMDRVDMPNFFLMVDMRHMVWSHDPLSSITYYIDRIHHAHIDYPLSFPARPFPARGDGFDYGPFLRALAGAGYSGGITIEADPPECWKTAAEEARAVLAPLAGG